MQQEKETATKARSRHRTAGCCSCLMLLLCCSRVTLCFVFQNCTRYLLCMTQIPVTFEQLM